MSEQEHVYDRCVIECIYKIQWNTISTLTISLLSIIAFVIFNARKLKSFKAIIF